jgi:hypothetical protein
MQTFVLEAGVNRTADLRIFIPGLAPTTYWNPDFDWSFTSMRTIPRPFLLFRVRPLEEKYVVSTPNWLKKTSPLGEAK